MPGEEHKRAGQESALLDVAVIGAGISGVCMGIRLRRAGIHNFRILERSQAVSGTWWDNTYPGAACDVPSHLYSYSFELNPDWSRVYSPQSEIRAYVERCVDKYRVRSHIRCGVEIVAARFDEGDAVWHLQSAAGESFRARVLISAVGALNRPHLPAFAGREDYQGAMFHTCRWDHGIDLTGKRVAIIGSAASAIQVAPQIAPEVARLSIFQRTPNYIIPRGDRAFTAAERARFRAWPGLMRLHRWKIYWSLDLRFPAFRQGSLMGRLGARQALAHMRATVQDPALRRKLVPDYPLGCKRILLSDDFYPTLNRENVELVTDGIERLTGGGIRTAGGRDIEADVIVLATGFRALDFLENLELTGRGGVSIHAAWNGGMEAYQGVAVAGFPNLFILLGPNTGLGHNSIIFMVEQQVNYIVSCLRRLGPGRTIEVSAEAMRRYNETIQRDLADMVWAANCASWYKAPDGRIPTLWPHNTVRYWRLMRRPRPPAYQLG